MSYWHKWIRDTGTLISKEDLILTAKQLYKPTVGAILVIETDLGMLMFPKKRTLREAAKKMPEGTKFRFVRETFSMTNGRLPEYAIMTYKGIHFDPTNWQGNLKHASHKQVVDLLHVHGKAVLDEISSEPTS